ncbi:MAG: hypothetical protein Q8S00_22280 [Deltaproteobacteria bacterium]|nr:hypothetical protein [Deltaproteobacteria bacterium]
MIASVTPGSMAPSVLNATGIGIKIPSSFLSLGIKASFVDDRIARTHIAMPNRIPALSLTLVALSRERLRLFPGLARSMFQVQGSRCGAGTLNIER